MESNKDDAMKCLNIGKAALGSGDATRAKKFLNKAKRLDPSLSVDEILAACDDLLKQPNNSTFASENPISKEQPYVNPRENSSRSDMNGNSTYTTEQAEIVRKVRRNKDYYCILGLEKSCTVEDVRKAYRKLSLKVHPDKNKAPGAEEAFKAVSKAFQCLSNEETRQKYDMTGPDEDFELSQQQAHVRRRRAHQGFYEDHFDPDEIFRSFFFGTPQTHFFHRANVMRARAATANNRTHGAGGDGGFSLLTLFQIMPILILLIFTYLPQPEPPPYSLQKTHPYQFRKVTKNFSVSYYVRSADFDQEYQPGSFQRDELERQVVRDYTNILSRYCHMELSRRQFNRNLETPHCDRLRQFETVR
eukprot:TRINITY_DN40092_c0_g1_i1.p1 TRINITY_DN40092_c0_g1~~TRINITY_DN40092_c0_g1_i1.p1  ORF type:complete len:360 (+),score=31.94 TRINITY_DN40092_c0_g1_i1:249-1328(+)